MARKPRQAGRNVNLNSGRATPVQTLPGATEGWIGFVAAALLCALAMIVFFFAV